MRYRTLAVLLSVLAGCTGTTPTPDAVSVTAPDGGADGTGATPDGTVTTNFSPTCPAADTVGQLARMLTVNNAAELAGGVIGNPALIHDELRRPITVTVTGPRDPLVVGPAWIMRQNDQDEDATIIITVTTVGTGSLCFVRATNLRWLDGAGMELGRDDVSYLTGSVGLLDVGYTQSCVGPKDTAFLVSAFPTAAAGAALYSNVRSVELALDLGEPHEVAPGQLVPVAYRQCGKLPLFEVEVESRGPDAIAFWDDLVGQYLLADEQGPLHWGFLSPRSGLGVYGPGMKMIVGADAFYRGAATRLQVYMAYDDPALYVPRAAHDETAAWLVAERAARRRLADRALAHLRAY